MLKMLIKRNTEKAYLIEDFIATNVSKERFERIKETNQEVLGDYVMVDPKDVDFAWWDRCFKLMTPKHVRVAQFEVDPITGKAKEVK